MTPEAAASLCCSAAANHIQRLLETSAIATSMAATTELLSTPTVKRGRYMQGGSIPPRKHSVWYLTDKKGDELEFLNFTSLTRDSFSHLVSLNRHYIKTKTITLAKGRMKRSRVGGRKFNSRDVVAMGLKYLLSPSLLKDLHVQFGASQTTFWELAWFAMDSFIVNVGRDARGRVWWDRSEEHLASCAERTNAFLDIVGVVAMTDGDKLVSKSPQNYLHQNRDYNGWTKDVNRNLVLVWDPFGKIVDAAVNSPGNFHDSKTAWWCKIYKHMEGLPQGFKCCCDDAFKTQGNLKDKLVKTKEAYKEGNTRSHYDQQLTHLRQCSEWGNNILTGVFRVMRSKLPTNNVNRAKIMWACIYLHNWRTETVGRNQIQTYFNNLVDE